MRHLFYSSNQQNKKTPPSGEWFWRVLYVTICSQYNGILDRIHLTRHNHSTKQSRRMIQSDLQDKSCFENSDNDFA